MDIDFIQTQYREDVLKLMEICGLDMKEAYELYTNSGYNFQAAVNRHFNPIQVPPPQQHKPYVSDNNYIPQEFNVDPYDEADIQYQQYKQFRRNGKPFNSKFPVRASKSFFQSFIPSFFKSNDQPEAFKQTLQRYIDKHTNLKDLEGNLSEAFHVCWKQKFPLAIIILNFSPVNQQSVKKVLGDDLVIQKILNQQFHPYGINSATYQLQDQLKTFINLERDTNSIIVCRVTFMDQIEVVSRIRINDGLEEVKKKIKFAKSSAIQSQLDQSNIVRQYQEQRKGNYNFQRPKTIKENLKQREDKKLRKQQQQEFFRACQPRKEEEKKQQPKKEQIKPNRNQIQKPVVQRKREEIRPQPQVISKQSISIEQITKMREQKYANLKRYNSGINFKIRVPSGQNIIVQVDPQERIHYLFEFISFQPQELGFINQTERKFDIFKGFGGSETLKGKQKLAIKQVFEDSQVLIVKEINE